MPGVELTIVDRDDVVLIELNMADSATTEDVKAAIRLHSQLPTGSMQLVYQGRMLREFRPLTYYSIPNGAKVTLKPASLLPSHEIMTHVVECTLAPFWRGVQQETSVRSAAQSGKTHIYVIPWRGSLSVSFSEQLEILDAENIVQLRVATAAEQWPELPFVRKFTKVAASAAPGLSLSTFIPLDGRRMHDAEVNCVTFQPARMADAEAGCFAPFRWYRLALLGQHCALSVNKMKLIGDKIIDTGERKGAFAAVVESDFIDFYALGPPLSCKVLIQSVMPPSPYMFSTEVADDWAPEVRSAAPPDRNIGKISTWCGLSIACTITSGDHSAVYVKHLTRAVLKDRSSIETLRMYGTRLLPKPVFKVVELPNGVTSYPTLLERVRKMVQEAVDDARHRAAKEWESIQAIRRAHGRVNDATQHAHYVRGTNSLLQEKNQLKKLLGRNLGRRLGLKLDAVEVGAVAIDASNKPATVDKSAAVDADTDITSAAKSNKPYKLPPRAAIYDDAGRHGTMRQWQGRVRRLQLWVHRRSVAPSEAPKSDDATQPGHANGSVQSAPGKAAPGSGVVWEWVRLRGPERRQETVERDRLYRSIPAYQLQSHELIVPVYDIE